MVAYRKGGPTVIRKEVPHEVRKQRDGRYAVVHPHLADPLGVFFETEAGWKVTMIDCATGGWAECPDVFDTRHAARLYILDRHRGD